MIDNSSYIFPIVKFEDGTGWKDVLDMIPGHLDEAGINRLVKVFSGKTKLKTVIIERHYIDKDYRNTFSNFHSKRFVTPDSRCVRLHFFEDGISRSDLLVPQKDKLEDAYYGYCIIRPTRPNCIGRTFLSYRCFSEVGYMAVCREKVRLQGISLNVDGFPFISQDVDATVCAESSLWMLQRYYSNKYRCYKETYPFEITKLKERHALGHRIYPTDGLSVIQISESLRASGFSPIIYYREHVRDNFENYLYSYIESGIPLILAFEGHAIIAIGHQLDFHCLTREKGIQYTSACNSALIVNDDNEFPYQILCRERKSSSRLHSKYSFHDIKSFVVPLAERIFLSAESFSKVVTSLLAGNDFGYTRKSSFLKRENIVLRLFLTTGQSYKGQLFDRNMGNDIVKFLYRELPFPHFIWVCEISTVDEIKKELVCGEIIWDATRNAHEPGGFVAIHYPEIIFIDIGSTLNLESEIVKYDLKPSTSYGLYKNNLVQV